MNDHLQSVKHVKKIFSNGGSSCPEGKCGFYVDHDEELSPKLVNHLIELHDYKILHIGTETSYTDGQMQMVTVTTLGK